MQMVNARAKCGALEQVEQTICKTAVAALWHGPAGSTSLQGCCHSPSSRTRGQRGLPQTPQHHCWAALPYAATAARLQLHLLVLQPRTTALAWLQLWQPARMPASATSAATGRTRTSALLHLCCRWTHGHPEGVQDHLQQQQQLVEQQVI
jgi:hypothetical protein